MNEISSLAKIYIPPNQLRSAVEIGLTLLLLVIGLAVNSVLIHFSSWLLLITIIPMSFIFTRIFLLQHDLGHGNLFKSRKINNAIGSFLGVLTFTPYHLWRKAHLIHHGSAGNTAKRPWIGDIDVLTTSEYRKKNKLGKCLYYLSRNPFIMFFFGSFYVFVVEQRFYKKIHREHKAFGKKELWSVINTNIAMLLFYGTIIALLGFKFFLLAFFVPLWLAGVMGIFLFFVQHNFEDKYVVSDEEWNLKDSALKGSTFFDLPQPFRWLTANIGYHHVHTLIPRIPFYRLKDCHQENNFLSSAPRVVFKDLPKFLSLKLYNEVSKKMITWKEYSSLLSANIYSKHSQEKSNSINEDGLGI